VDDASLTRSTPRYNREIIIENEMNTAAALCSNVHYSRDQGEGLESGKTYRMELEPLR